MKYEILATNRFRKDLRTAIRRGYDIQLLQDVVSFLANGNPLPDQHRDHLLYGNWAGFRECHITSDWLLIYRIDSGMLVLTLTRTRTHSDLF